MPEYALIFDDSFYAGMVRRGYKHYIRRWMAMESVLNEATNMPRSKKKLDQLWKKGAIMVGDTLTMRKTANNGTEVVFSATIEAINPSPKMRTIGEGDGKAWICANPADFESKMAQTKGNLVVSNRNIWDAISVTRGNKELGSLFLFRQCLELWEIKMEKWGCNGLGEKLGDR